MPEIFFFQTFLWAYSLCQRMGSTVINESHTNINEEANHSPLKIVVSIWMSFISCLMERNKGEAGREIFLNPELSG